jgi:hypothetical protein
VDGGLAYAVGRSSSITEWTGGLGIGLELATGVGFGTGTKPFPSAAAGLFLGGYYMELGYSYQFPLPGFARPDWLSSHQFSLRIQIPVHRYAQVDGARQRDWAVRVTLPQVRSNSAACLRQTLQVRYGNIRDANGTTEGALMPIAYFRSPVDYGAHGERWLGATITQEAARTRLEVGDYYFGVGLSEDEEQRLASEVGALVADFAHRCLDHGLREPEVTCEVYPTGAACPKPDAAQLHGSD